ncbi:holo-ACP synthase [Umezawaea tangerina]|uniref:Holo-[acyl-carrier protein] synthase n=1 Tax=Umezawaea tangerina TaxID=84725 RepID=A0A2T0SXJ1_9PSEU|nr:holo-ACP synthase [Umezawaea tangerina]PRY38132.1 holo-[acyl-carrier protein] synthase [Umezawaea tangerina]
MRLGIDLLTRHELDGLLTRRWFRRFAFADAELAHAESLAAERGAEFLAGRFAAKEAVLKVLGTGLFQGVVPSHIAVTRDPSGAPAVLLRDSACTAADAAGISRVTVSITHKGELVAAVAVGW